MCVRPEKHLELKQTLSSLVAPAGRETGCLSYGVSCDIEDRNRFSLMQSWETRDLLDHHIRSDRFGVLLGTKSLLSRPPRIEIYTILQAEGMEAIVAIRDKIREYTRH